MRLTKLLLVWITAVVVLLSLCMWLWKLGPESKTKERDKNIAIFFHDVSSKKQNPSVELLLDNKVIFQSDSIVKGNRQDFEIELDTGIHFVKVQTLNGNFADSAEIDVEEINQRYILSLKFSNNLLYESHDTLYKTDERHFEIQFEKQPLLE